MQDKSIFLDRNIIRNTFNDESVLKHCIAHSDSLIKINIGVRNHFPKCWENISPPVGSSPPFVHICGRKRVPFTLWSGKAVVRLIWCASKWGGCVHTNATVPDQGTKLVWCALNAVGVKARINLWNREVSPCDPLISTMWPNCIQNTNY